jgi:hypothetical protein
MIKGANFGSRTDKNEMNLNGGSRLQQQSSITSSTGNGLTINMSVNSNPSSLMANEIEPKSVTSNAPEQELPPAQAKNSVNCFPKLIVVGEPLFQETY